MPNRLPSVSLTGDAEFASLLRNLGDKEILSAATKVMRSVGSNVIRGARKRLVKGHGVNSGMLKKSLGIRKVKTYKGSGTIVMYLGPRRGFRVGSVVLGNKKITKTGYKKIHDPFYIAHLVEFGHKASGWNAGGKDVPEKPFLRPAVDENRTEYPAQMIAKLKEVLSKPAKKK